MEGLLRKYKISKISDTIKMTPKELKICHLLDKLVCFKNNDGLSILEYKKDNLYVNWKYWNVLENYGLDKLDIQTVIHSWTEDIYSFGINKQNIHRMNKPKCNLFF